MNCARVIATCLLVFSAHASYAQQQGVVIKSDFLTGNSYRNLSPAGKRGYAMGFAGGAFMAPVFGAKKQEVVWLENCITGMNDEQLVAVFDKWLAENPVRWHEQMNVLAFRALREGCRP